MGPFSDERLARRAAKGDRRALEAIYRRYGQPLYRFCLALVGNREDAQDALQNTMVKVVGALPGEQRAIRLKPWLYRIARNEAVETLRRRRHGSELDPEMEAGDDVAGQAEARERLRELLGDLELLPERQRSVLLMRELSGLGFAEIGEALDTSSAVTRQTLYEARLGLRQLQQGREMGCAEVTRELSDGDGRVARRREIRSHLRSCPACRAFRAEIETRRKDLAAISPLPLALAAGLLQGVLGTGSIAATVTTSAAVKSAAAIAVATAIGVSAADRGGLVELPLPANERDGVVRGAPSPPRVGSTRAVKIAPPAARDSVKPVAAARQGEEVAAADAVDLRPGPKHGPAPAPPAASSSPSTEPMDQGASPSDTANPPSEPAPSSAHGQQIAASKRPAHAGGPSAQGVANAGPKGAKVPPGQEQPGPPRHAQVPAATGERSQQPPDKDRPEQKSNGAQAKDEVP